MCVCACLSVCVCVIAWTCVTVYEFVCVRVLACKCNIVRNYLAQNESFVTFNTTTCSFVSSSTT